MSAAPFLNDYLCFYFYRMKDKFFASVPLNSQSQMLFIALVWSQDTECTVNNSNMHRHTQIVGAGSSAAYTSVLKNLRASLVAQLVKNPPAMQETSVRFLGHEDPLEKGFSTHFRILGLPW